MRKPVLITVIVVVAAVLIGVVLQLSYRPDASGVLGVSVPASATNMQIEIQRDPGGMLFGEYRGYVRFEIPQADLNTFLADPTFQQVPPPTTGNPLDVMQGSSGGVPAAQEAAQNRPAWWTPEQGASFRYTQRSKSQTITTGPDIAWYIIDVSDPSLAIVYVYMVEV